MAERDAPTLAPPQGTITVVMGDVEGSTPLWDADADAMRTATVQLDRMISAGVALHGGYRSREQGEGDNFVATFSRGRDAVAFALDLQRAIADASWADGFALRVRIGLHTGDAYYDDESGYDGPTFNRCARVRDLGHGGQTLLTNSAHDVAADAPPGGVAFEDLGHATLRGLGRTEHVFQLVHGDLTHDFPPLRTAEQLPNNLPVPQTPFLGRDREAAELADELASARVLTLTGAGGSGKTRLALWLAEKRLTKYPDGVWWVDLAPLSDPARIPLAILAAAGVSEEPGVEPSDVVRRHFSGRAALLILDNCEHVIDAVAERVVDLTGSCTRLTVLATSREPLGIHGEVTRRVSSLSTPPDDIDVDALDDFDASRLFVERARAVGRFEPNRDDAAVIARICRRLDGIPLALELAAARTKMLAVREIADALDDRFRLLTSRARTTTARQKTLAASMAWSYDLLDDDEQAVLNRLGVFAAWFDLAAARAVASLDDPYLDVLDILESLVDKSLVQVEKRDGGAWYRLLETVRAYAVDRLADAGELEAAQDAHLEHFTAEAERLGPDIATTRFVDAAAELDARFADIRKAMAWAQESGQLIHVLRTADAIMEYYWTRLYLFELAEMLTAAFGAAAEGPEHAAKAMALAAGPAALSGDTETGRALGQQALDLATEHALPEIELLARYALLVAAGWSTRRRATDELATQTIDRALSYGEHPRAVLALNVAADAISHTRGVEAGLEVRDRAQALATSLGYERGVALARIGRAVWTTTAGRFEQALDVATDLTTSRAGTSVAIAGPLVECSVVGLASLALGRYDRAREATARAVGEASARTIARDVVDIHAAIIHLALGEPAAAAPLLDGLAGAWRESPRGPLFPVWLACLQSETARATGDLGAAARAMADAHAHVDLEDLELGTGSRLSFERAALALANGDVATARADVVRCIRFRGQGGYLCWLPRDLELAAQIEAAAGEPASAARLVAAAGQVRADTDAVRFPVDEPVVATLVDRLRADLGDVAFDEACAAATNVGWQDVVAAHAHGNATD